MIILDEIKQIVTGEELGQLQKDKSYELISNAHEL